MVNEQSFIDLLNKHQNIIHKVCHLYMNDVSGREDLFQEVTLQAWKAYPKFRGESQFSTWLYRIALNTAITFYRKAKRQPVIYSDIIPEQTETSSETEEQLKAMYKSISDLSKTDKALVMLYLEDYNYNDIGEILGITPNNVAVKMNRIKLKLKESSTKYYEHP